MNIDMYVLPFIKRSSIQDQYLRWHEHIFFLTETIRALNNKCYPLKQIISSSNLKIV